MRVGNAGAVPPRPRTTALNAHGTGAARRHWCGRRALPDHATRWALTSRYSRNRTNLRSFRPGWREFCASRAGAPTNNWTGSTVRSVSRSSTR